MPQTLKPLSELSRLGGKVAVITGATQGDRPGDGQPVGCHGHRALRVRDVVKGGTRHTIGRCELTTGVTSLEDLLGTRPLLTLIGIHYFNGVYPLTAALDPISVVERYDWSST